MEAQDWVIVIAAVTGMLTAVIGAVFAGFVALRQMPRQQRAQEETKAEVEAVKQEAVATRKTTDAASTRFHQANASLNAKLDSVTAEAMAASRAREMPMFDAEHPMPVTLSETPVPVVIQRPEER